MTQLTDIEKELFKVSIANKFRTNWTYYDKNNNLCTLTNDRRTIKIKNDVIEVNKWYKKLAEKNYANTISVDEIKNELVYIKKSEELKKKSFELTDYINNEIGNYNGCTSYDIIWFNKKDKKDSLSENYIKITIDIHKYEIRVFNYDQNKDIITTSKNLKAFLKLNKSKILKIIKENKKLHKVKMQRYKKINKEQKLKERIEIELEKETSTKGHDATRKVGSRVESATIYIQRPLKERYETQAQKPFHVKYPWESL